jgi:hypothetical protein
VGAQFARAAVGPQRRVNEDAHALQTVAFCEGLPRESLVAFATVILDTLFTCLRAFVWRIRVRGVRRARLTSAWTRWRSTCWARFAKTWEAQTDKNVQNNYIVLPTTTTQYSSARHTLRAAVVASQQLLQAPRSPESACKRPARKHAHDEHGDAQTAPTRCATIADRSTHVPGWMHACCGRP